jgi:hypothetical protein
MTACKSVEPEKKRRSVDGSASVLGVARRDTGILSADKGISNGGEKDVKAGIWNDEVTTVARYSSPP